MSDTLYYVLSGVLVLGVLLGIFLMSKVKASVKGNAISAVSMLLAIVLIFIRYKVFEPRFALLFILIGLAIGSIAGIFITVKVKMIQMPQTVALLNGFGGGASAIVGAITVAKNGFEDVTSILAVVVGMVTLVGSLIAASKLHGLMSPRPKVFKGHKFFTTATLILSIACCVAAPFAVFDGNMGYILLIATVVFAGLFGFFFSIRVGGADMPITISLLNSFSGVAGAIAGLAIGDALLVAVGGIVGASGLILTQIMCRAMNRHLFDILLGKTSGPAKPVEKKAEPVKTEEPKKEVVKEKVSPAVEAADVLRNAKKVIIIPGYGMALGQAQSLVKQLSDKLEQNGAEVKFAIHPVAGRMPGHMNVLLCEVDVPYEKLYEMDAINDEFKDTDAVIIVGANDVVNPAAREAEGTPIYGMPVLRADEAKHVIIFNYDLKPGYAGVENPLYHKEEGVSILLGDAKETVLSVISELSNNGAKAEKKEACGILSKEDEAAEVLANAKRVIIIPGYGMALGQAQSLVKQLSDKLEQNGTEVKFAIHPVAGRMPGHMNVLLCEVDVPYEKLYEMDAINGEFKDTDAVIIVGANDVVNPAAREAEGTPIYGMPVLRADEAKHVIIFNYDLKPGYAGVENPLYHKESGVTILLGDAKQTVLSVINSLSNVGKKEACTCAGAEAGEAGKKDPKLEAAEVLRNAKDVIIIPGYGMALGQAQSLVKQLSDKLEQNGARVRFAIHPVAGRMPGHMNVLLCEVDVPYEKLYEMDAINDDFDKCDAAIIVGANDVVNPAAREAEGTPIYGMPVLCADKAKHVIIFNYDLKPGYAGVENPLYHKEEGVSILLGDAKETVLSVLTSI